MSALSSQAACLSTKIEVALKQQENAIRKMKQINRSQKDYSKQEGTSNSKLSRGTSTDSFASLTHMLDSDHCLAVTRGIVTLLLAMDHSCSVDMFLLACKVMLYSKGCGMLRNYKTLSVVLGIGAVSDNSPVVNLPIVYD